jgi:hypothetical protein
VPDRDEIGTNLRSFFGESASATLRRHAKQGYRDEFDTGASGSARTIRAGLMRIATVYDDAG